MSRKTLLAWLSSLVMGLVIAPAAHAQHVTPFIEPNYFNPDFQFFAPADVTVYDDAPEAPIGWFFCYDRAFMNVSRSSTQLRSWEGDETWGNRFELGYMTNDDKGWLATIWHIDGPNINEIATSDATAFQISPFRQSGSATLTSVEINKTWRKHLHNGAILEPMLGMRYVDYSEAFFERALNGTVAGGIFTLTSTDNNSDFVQNNMLEGQLGVRYAQQHGHWILSGDFRIAAGVNFQYYEFTSLRDPVDATLANTVVRTAANASVFTLMGAARMDAQYVLTRDVALHFGLEVDDYGRGVGRVNSSPRTDDRLVAAGLTMGFTINR